MLFGVGINAARQRANLPKIKYSRFSHYNSNVSINNVEVKNIGSAGFTKTIFLRTVTKSQCAVDIAICRSKIKSTVVLKKFRSRAGIITGKRSLCVRSRDGKYTGNNRNGGHASKCLGSYRSSKNAYIYKPF